MSKPKLHIIMIGLEENMEIADHGERTRMISKILSELDFVESILIIHAPLSIPRRILSAIRRGKRIKDMYPLIQKRLLSSLYRVNEKTLMMNLTSIIPESDTIFCRLDRERLARNIQEDIVHLGFHDPIVWISNPRVVDMAERITARYKIFDAIDDLLKHPQMKRFYPKITRAYKWVDEKADLICFASEKQRDMFPNNKNRIVLPNGVDDIFFQERERIVPDDLNKIPHPIVGYMGVLQDRFDTKLMNTVARRLPHINFVLVGPVSNRKHFKSLQSRNNVYFLGPKSYNSVPDYISCFDVAIIPHVINEFTESMNPLKIYEYLACGKPIVSTPIMGTEPFRNVITIASDPDAFISAISRAIGQNTPEAIANRKKIARQNSFEFAINDFFKTNSFLLGK
ncbi:MAG: glycosyltransferase [Spirochaetes bacterium]|nr:glycosyltransferase [Spirochaetota bacterium]